LAQKKGNGKKKTATGAKRKNTVNKSSGNALMQREAAVTFLFVLSALLFFSNFGFCGVVGKFLKELQLGLFGVIGYFFPVLLFLSCVYGISNIDNRQALLKIPACFLAAVSIAGIIHLFFGKPFEDAGSIAEFYRSGSAGGVLGGVLSGACRAVIGKVGAFLILAAAFIISMVCITEKSFVNAVRNEGGRAYLKAREDIGKRRERHEEREKERKLKKSAEVPAIDLKATDLSRTAAVPPVPPAEPVPQEAESPAASGEDFASGEETEFVTPEEAVPVENAADTFTGTIRKPVDYDVDTVPFDTDADAGEDAGIIEACRKADEILKTEKDYPDPTKDAYVQQTLDAEGGERTIVTSTGKVIESDTDMIHKKMEEKRAGTEVGQVRTAVEEKKAKQKPYFIPPFNLMERPKKSEHPFSEKEYKETAVKLQQTLQNFGVGVTVTNISCGPVVTRYELHPEQGVKVSRIVALSDDIKLSLAASDIRIEAPIPGKSAIGIEVPNKENNIVYLRELLESEEFKNNKYKIAFAVGKDIGGQIVVTDISKMPHLLIAGATGSGKSVCINTLIVGILYKYRPDEVQMIMIDPKVVELSVFNGIPHLLIPVVTDPKKAAGALNWAVAEMTERYKKFAVAGVRDLKGYNEKIDADEAAGKTGEEDPPAKMAQIVIIIDELADLMMVAQNEVEDAICRLAQLARAAGIHLVIATQRPSVNVITGLIKANIPSRIAFAVSAGVDSRTILDEIGAEKLLGKGDMLFAPQGAPKPMRVQGAFISDREVQKIVEYILKQGFNTSYDSEAEEKIASGQTETSESGAGGSRDDLFAQAGRFIIEKDKASIGNLQRMFKIGFNRAARIMDQLCEAGVVGEEQGTKPREILMSAEEFEQMIRNSR